jgi:hypothetical protein
MSTARRSAVVLGVVLCLSGALAAHADEALEQAKLGLNPGGVTEVVPAVSFGTADGAGSDSLVVAEPALLQSLREALKRDPALVDADDTQVRRLLNLRANWNTIRRSVPFRQSLSVLREKSLDLAVRTGSTSNEAVVAILSQDFYGLRQALSIPEIGGGTTTASTQQAYQEVSEIICFDEGYHVWRRTFWGEVWCRKGGDGCGVEVDCP